MKQQTIEGHSKGFYQVVEDSDALAVVERLPVAELRALYATADVPGSAAAVLERVSDKAVFCQGQHVGTVSDRYVLVQHREAFAPIINALREQERSFQCTAWATKRKAFLGVYIGNAADGVRFGFRAENNVDGSGSLKYGLKAGREVTEVAVVEKERVLVWTYRQVCSNGAKIKVPLTSERYLDTVTRRRFEQLLVAVRSIRHTGNVKDRVQEVQYLTTAFLLLETPLNRMIQDAQAIYFDDRHADQLIQEYIGENLQYRIWTAYQQEDDNSLWSLFNAITGQATHANLSDGTREVLLEKASNLLTDELERHADALPEVTT